MRFSDFLRKYFLESGVYELHSPITKELQLSLSDMCIAKYGYLRKSGSLTCVPKEGK